METLTGAGTHSGLSRQASNNETRQNQAQTILLWNNHATPHVNYKFLALDLNGRQIRRQGRLPSFAALTIKDTLLNLTNDQQDVQSFQRAEEWFSALPRRFRVKALAERDAVIQFRITGDTGIAVYFLVQQGLASVIHGEHSQPHASLTVDGIDFLALVNGQASAIDLFTQGKIQVGGDAEMLLSVYQSLDVIPQNKFQAQQWKLEVDYLGMLLEKAGG
jgi:hypothetical protein